MVAVYESGVNATHREIFAVAGKIFVRRGKSPLRQRHLPHGKEISCRKKTLFSAVGTISLPEGRFPSWRENFFAGGEISLPLGRNSCRRKISLPL